MVSKSNQKFEDECNKKVRKDKYMCKYSGEECKDKKNKINKLINTTIHIKKKNKKYFESNIDKKINETKKCSFYSDKKIEYINRNLQINKNIHWNCKGIKKDIDNKTEIEDRYVIDNIINNNNFIYRKHYRSIVQYLNRKKAIYNKLCCNIISHQAIIQDKMVIGLGEASVRKVNIKLDHIYGIPFIPASSIKGGFRYFVENNFEFYNKETFEEFCGVKKDERKLLIELLFGSQDKQGGLIFLDAYPINNEFKVVNDIMTPHYKDYYDINKSDFPTDDQNPNPILFFVLKDAKFKFDILFHNSLIAELKKSFKIDKDMIKKIKAVFEEFLKNEPFGAKKAVGYGYMKEV